MNANQNSVLDRHFGVHAPALEFRSARARVLASNLTNADTPNFKARDIRFEDVLRAKGLETGRSGVAGVQMAATHSAHIRTGGDTPGDARLMYRNPYQPTLDGNTVEADVEQGKFAENSVQYQASLMFLSGKIRGLRDAIKGGA
jgi:flagellar basal-body rod protein FlgB